MSPERSRQPAPTGSAQRRPARYQARYRRIVWFFARVVAQFLFWDVLLPHLGLRRLARRNRSQRLSRTAANFRALAIKLGGVMIKVGQFFSARVDVLPVEITQELAGLQDEVPAEDFDSIRQVVEAEYGAPLESRFIRFDPLPEAAASLGQVHRAKVMADETSAGEMEGAPQLLDIVVKVQRPDIEQIISTDLAALRTVGNWLKRYPPISRRADVPALLAEFTRILMEEIDYLAEGRNAETFAAHFKSRPGVRVPAVLWTHTTRRVLALENVQGIKITDYEAIRSAGIDLAQVAERLFQTYLLQIFEDGFFHADPHPGNMFVTPAPAGPAGWLLTFVDFGMVGHMPSALRAGMRELVIAVGTRDAARIVGAYQQLGVLLPGADLELLEKAEAEAFRRFWGMSMSELRQIPPQEMMKFAGEFRSLIYDLPFQIPEDLILLGRTVGILSGMCTGLNPEFNVWQGLAPFAQRLIAEEAGRSAPWLEKLGELARLLLSYPRQVQAVLEKLEHGELAVRTPQLVTQVASLEKSANRISGAIVFAGLLLAGVQLYLAGHELCAAGLLAVAGIALIWLMVGRPGQ